MTTSKLQVSLYKGNNACDEQKLIKRIENQV
jgi:hypothetical protein